MHATSQNRTHPTNTPSKLPAVQIQPRNACFNPTPSPGETHPGPAPQPRQIHADTCHTAHAASDGQTHVAADDRPGPAQHPPLSRALRPRLCPIGRRLRKTRATAVCAAGGRAAAGSRFFPVAWRHIYTPGGGTRFNTLERDVLGPYRKCILQQCIAGVDCT